MESFYSLPFELILAIVSQTDFSNFKQPYQTLYEFIDKTIKIYRDDSILLLQNIHLTSETINIDECFKLIELFSNSDILRYISKYYETTKQKIDCYEETIKKQESYIKVLQLNIQSYESKLKLSTSEQLEENTNQKETFQPHYISNLDMNPIEVLQNFELLQRLPLNEIFTLLSEIDFS